MIPPERPRQARTEDLRWRALVPSDRDNLAELESTARLHDCPQAAVIEGHYWHNLPVQPLEQDDSLCAVLPTGKMVAAVRLTLDYQQPDADRANFVGLVHPAYRRQGLGSFLLAWAEGNARQRLEAAQGKRPATLHIRNEALTDSAVALYRNHGYEWFLIEHVMRYDLTTGLPEMALPANLDFVPWSAQTASRFFQVYEAAFRERPGFPGWSEERWIEWISGDDDFHPECSLLVSLNGQDAGFIGSAIIPGDDVRSQPSVGWIAQLGVCPEFRGRRLSAVLLCEVFRHFVEKGIPIAMLDVNRNNPYAIAAYEKLGFTTVAERARFSKLLREVN